eukprot:5101892-Ditylum_brightwellii.AAC.1
MVMLAMTVLDKGLVVCMHSFELFWRYSVVGTNALDRHTLAFVDDTVKCQLPLLFSLTTGNGGTAAEKILRLVRGSVAPSLTPLMAHLWHKEVPMVWYWQQWVVQELPSRIHPVACCFKWHGHHILCKLMQFTQEGKWS